jgi:hypothetical protein
MCRYGIEGRWQQRQAGKWLQSMTGCLAGANIGMLVCCYSAISKNISRGLRAQTQNKIAIPLFGLLNGAVRHSFRLRILNN